MTRPRPAVLLAAGAVTAALALAAFGVLPWPRCPFHEYLGLDCPMCGTTRAGLAMLAGDYAAAFRENPVWWLWLFWTLAAFADLWHRAWRANGTVGQRLVARVAGSPALSGSHAAAALLVFAYRNFLR
jgi:hypothetical protein